MVPWASSVINNLLELANKDDAGEKMLVVRGPYFITTLKIDVHSIVFNLATNNEETPRKIGN